LEAGVGGEQLLIDLADRFGSRSELAAREGEDGVGLVEGDQALDVTGMARSMKMRPRSSGRVAGWCVTLLAIV
ncbi:MAG TPA: hypothetical protein VFA45_18455, partial [Actinomycetes bacterium]|nr:hypothetical protein [Actinomycetes bacterium]